MQNAKFICIWGHSLIFFPILLLLAFKFYNKSDDHSDVQEQLIQICEFEEACEKAVEYHFDSCFEENYSIGTNRRGAKLKVGELLGCINQKMGKEIFYLEKT